jgi:hypothetical protein
MLVALTPPAESMAEGDLPEQSPRSPQVPAGPSTDLVGSWKAESL